MIGGPFSYLLNRRRWPLALMASVLQLCRVAHGAETWVGAGAGVWSNNLNWLDGSAPPAGGNSSLTISFSDTQASSLNATLDLGTFSLSRLTLGERLPSFYQIDASGGSQLRFASAAQSLIFSGSSTVEVTAPIILTPSATHLLISGDGLGVLQLNAISEEIAGQRVVIEMSPFRSDLGSVVLQGAGSYTGGTELRSGNLRVNQATALGTGPLLVYGGTVSFGTSLATDAQLYSDLTLANTGSVIWSGVLSSQTAATGLNVRGGEVVTLTKAATYTGGTTLDRSLTPSQAVTASGPRLVLSGASSLLASSGYNVLSGSSLQVEAEAGGLTNRLSDTAPVILKAAQLRFADTTETAVAKSENVGALSIAGQASIALAAGPAGMTLASLSLTRVDRGTLLVTGLGSGTGAFLTGAAPVLIGGAVSGPTTKIVPFALGDSIAGQPGSGFVTYTTAEGFQLLKPTDYSNAITADANVRLSATVKTTSATINSLWLDGVALNSTGTPTLTITSGGPKSRSTPWPISAPTPRRSPWRAAP